MRSTLRVLKLWYSLIASLVTYGMAALDIDVLCDKLYIVTDNLEIFMIYFWVNLVGDIIRQSDYVEWFLADIRRYMVKITDKLKETVVLLSVYKRWMTLKVA